MRLARAEHKGSAVSHHPTQRTIPLSHAAAIAAGVAVFLGYQWVFRDWVIEDAAISFAYARNWVEGNGLVAVAGGERIEGYSNPLWVALLALFQGLGLDGFDAGKAMACLFGSACVPFAWLLAREALPEGRKDSAWIAPILVGWSAHHAIWSASALENSLFNALVLGGSWQLLRDVRRGGWPWSAAWFLGLGLTRPEGTAYAGLAGLFYLIFTWRDRRSLRPALLWAAAYWVPFGLFEAWRIWYFALPLPNTYYAKFVTQGNFPMRWYARGWDQVRSYAWRTGMGFALPLVILGTVGITGWRRRASLGIAGVLSLLLLIPGPLLARELFFWPAIPEPVEWLRFRIGVIAVMTLVLPFVALGGPGGRARALLWSMAGFALWFGVLSNGDWMRGLRWMSLFVCPAAVLIAVGLDALNTWLAEWRQRPRYDATGWLLVALLIGISVPPQLVFARWYRGWVDDYPQMIKRRVDHSAELARRVFLEDRLRPLDMDMGAHMWWGDQHPVDMAGLIDIPMSLHRYNQRRFIEEYVFEETRPHVAHVHLRWAEISGFKTYPMWSRDYIPYVGYIDGRNFHDGLWARRDLFMDPAYRATVDRRTRFARGVVLTGLEIPSPEVGRGRALYVESGWLTEFKRNPEDPFSVTLFIHRDGRVVSWDLPMGYTMLGYPVMPVHWWKPSEVFVGRFGVPLPPDLEEGSWDVGVVVRGAKGYVLTAGGPEGNQQTPPGGIVGGRDADAVFARGEIRFPNAITVVTSSEVEALAKSDRSLAIQQAEEGLCTQSESTWIAARRHIPHDRRFANANGPDVERAFASCWTARAAVDTENAAQHLARAHHWDPKNADLIAAKAPLADGLYRTGMAARAEEDWETAYRAFAAILTFAPERSWARIRAEEARDKRLGITSLYESPF